jgi:hypothetical protein
MAGDGHADRSGDRPRGPHDGAPVGPAPAGRPPARGGRRPRLRRRLGRGAGLARPLRRARHDHRRRLVGAHHLRPRRRPHRHPGGAAAPAHPSRRAGRDRPRALRRRLAGRRAGVEPAVPAHRSRASRASAPPCCWPARSPSSAPDWGRWPRPGGGGRSPPACRRRRRSGPGRAHPAAGVAGHLPVQAPVAAVALLACVTPRRALPVRPPDRAQRRRAGLLAALPANLAFVLVRRPRRCALPRRPAGHRGVELPADHRRRPGERACVGMFIARWAGRRAACWAVGGPLLLAAGLAGLASCPAPARGRRPRLRPVRGRASAS